MVGKSDFNETPVVSPDFDLGFVNSWNQIDSRKFLRMKSGPLVPTENLGLCKSTLLDWYKSIIVGEGLAGVK